MDFDTPRSHADSDEIDTRASSKRTHVLSLLSVHRIQWITGTGDGPDFHKHSASRVSCYEVDFRTPKPTIAIEDLQTLALKPMGGERLSPSAQV